MTTNARTADVADVDLLGAPLTEDENELIRLYMALKEFSARESLPPNVKAASLAALAPLAVAVTDLGLEFEHLIDLGA